MYCEYEKDRKDYLRTQEEFEGQSAGTLRTSRGGYQLVAIERGEGNPKLVILLSILDMLELQMAIELKN